MVVALSMLANLQSWAKAPVLAAPAPYGGASLYQPGGRHRPIAAGLALGGAAVVLAGLMTALVAPEILTYTPPTIDVTNYPLPKPPPPTPQPEPDAQRQNRSVLTAPDPITDTREAATGTIITLDPFDGTFPPSGGGGTGIGSGGGDAVITAPPLITAARRNPRFAGDFQPPYPAAQEREQVEGRCPVSVTIAPSGRVSAVRDAGCSDPAFFRVTQRQALTRWRFEPASRDGVAIESTLTQTVVFRLP
ncbi:MAG: energy transducer TonB [Sphingopyxis sp.]